MLLLIFILALLFAAELVSIRSLRRIGGSAGGPDLVLSLTFSAGLVAIDQLIKLLVVMYLPECRGAIRSYHTLTLFGQNIVSLTHIRNDGAGWSILGGKTVLLSSFTAIVVIGLLIFMVIKHRKLKKAEWISLSLIIGGGVGNLIDRLRMLIEGTDRFAGVIDYIKLDFINYPVFNFADCCVVVGAILLCLVMIIDEFSESRDKKNRKRLLAAAEQEEAKNEGDDEPL